MGMQGLREHTQSQNKTKVGLKGRTCLGYPSKKIGQNKTKVGLKGLEEEVE